jgi:hypothetical protein
VYRVNEQQQRVLSAGLRALGESARSAAASPRVERAVMAEALRVLGTRPVSSRPAPARRWLPLAAGLVLAVGGALWSAGSPPAPDRRVITPTGFVMLPSAYGLPDMESASIMRISVPVSALPAYGLPMAPDAATGSIEAELLVAQDGQPRAIRLVNDSTDSRSRP